jgi:hypothetical protein
MGERFILAHISQAFSPRLLDPMYLGRTSSWCGYVVEEVLHLRVNRKQERGNDRDQV